MKNMRSTLAIATAFIFTMAACESIAPTAPDGQASRYPMLPSFQAATADDSDTTHSDEEADSGEDSYGTMGAPGDTTAAGRGGGGSYGSGS